MEDRSEERPQDPQFRRQRDNTVALVSIAVGTFFLVSVLWASGFIVFVPIVVGIALYAFIARLFFRVFRVEVGPMGMPPPAPPPPQPPFGSSAPGRQAKSESAASASDPVANEASP